MALCRAPPPGTASSALCMLSGTAAQKLEASPRGPTGQCGAVVFRRLILGLWATCCLRHPRYSPGPRAAHASRSRSQGSGVTHWLLHHAGPEPGRLCRGGHAGPLEFVDVHAGWCTHAAIVADEHVGSAGGMGRGDRGVPPITPAVLAPSPHHLHLYLLPAYTLCGVFARVTLLLPPPYPERLGGACPP